MGCPHCKLLDASDSESHENVIANVAAKTAEPCGARDGATTNSNTTPPTNQPSNLALTESEVTEMDHHSTLNNATTHISNEVPITSPIHLCDVDSNILSSAERLEAGDGVRDLTSSPPPSSTADLETEGPSSSPAQQDREPEATNCTTNTADEQECNQSSDSPSPLRRNRGTVRVNSIRGHKVTRKLSINPGDTVISASQRDFVQLGGHQGHFHIAGPGCLWKQQAKDGDIEAKVLKDLNEGSLHAYVPDYLGSKEHDGKKWIGMEDLQTHFTDGCGMDIKMGTRTFKESEVKNQKLRADLYAKMVALDPKEPSEQENKDKAITKLRYMTFRERESSSQTLGFRIEAMKIWGQPTNKDFKTLKHKEQVKNALKIYLNNLSKSGLEGFMSELDNLNQLLQESTFFKEHEFVGTSILFIYDRERVGLWLIDFGKTTDISDLLEGGQITHEKPWELGNYEDGYFYGMKNLLEIVREILEERTDDDESVHIRVN